MPRTIPQQRTTDTEQDWADAGQPIGSPNDPAVGKAHDQTTGPGGDGLRAPKQKSGDKTEDAVRPKR